MKFKTPNDQIVEAIKFHYSIEGSRELLEFGGFNIGRIGKAYTHDSLAEVEIGEFNENGIFHVTEIAFEGDWIVKNSEGKLHVWGPELFEKAYERLENE